MSNNDGNSSEDLVLLDECQKEFTESYLAVLLRILKKFPDCTYGNAESKIFQSLEIPEPNLEIKPASISMSGEDIWNDIPETSPPISSSSIGVESSQDNAIMNKIEEIRRAKSLRYRDAIRAIRLQMLIDHVSSQSQEPMSQVKLMQTLTRKLNHLYEMTPPPKPVIINDVSTLQMNNKFANNGIDHKDASIVVSTNDNYKSDLMSSSAINISDGMIMSCATAAVAMHNGNTNNNNAIMADGGGSNMNIMDQHLLPEKDIIPMYDVSNLMQTRLDKDKDQEQTQEASYETRSRSNGSYTKNTCHSNVGGEKLTTMGHNIGISNNNNNNSPSGMRSWKSGHKKIVRKHTKHMIRSNYISGSATSFNKSSSKDRELDRNLKRKRKYMEEIDNYNGFESNDYEWEYSDPKETNVDCNETKSGEWEEREKERDGGMYGAPPNKKYRRVVSKRTTLPPQYSVDMYQLHKRSHSNQE